MLNKVNGTIVLLTLFLLTTINAVGQSKYVGKYVLDYYGIDKEIRSIDTSQIRAELYLNEDGSFEFEIVGVFSWCRTMYQSTEGTWESRGHNIFLFTDYSILEGLHHKSYRRLQPKHYHGEEHSDYIEIVQHEKCPSIFFNVNWDCLESIPKEYPLRKIDCKQKGHSEE